MNHPHVISNSVLSSILPRSSNDTHQKFTVKYHYLFILTFDHPETVFHQDRQKCDFEFCFTDKIDHTKRSVIVWEPPEPIWA